MSALSLRLAVGRTSGRYDPAERKQGKRSQRERGCWVYIAADELVAAGIDPYGPAPFYRAHGFQRSRNAGSVIVSLYRDR
jgi:hypothetical protein